jgi:hypothetical protein
MRQGTAFHRTGSMQPNAILCRLLRRLPTHIVGANARTQTKAAVLRFVFADSTSEVICGFLVFGGGW